MVCLGTAEFSSPGFSYSAIYTAKIFICILAQANMIYLVTLGYLFAISIIESLRNEFAFQIPLRKCKNHFYHYLTWATYSRRPRWLFKSQFPKSGFCQLRFSAPKLLLVSTFSRLNWNSGNYPTSPKELWPCQRHEKSALAKCLTQKWLSDVFLEWVQVGNWRFRRAKNVDMRTWTRYGLIRHCGDKISPSFKQTNEIIHSIRHWNSRCQTIFIAAIK